MINIGFQDEHERVKVLVETKYKKAQTSFVLNPGGSDELRFWHYVAIKGDNLGVYTIIKENPVVDIDRGYSIYRAIDLKNEQLSVLVMKTSQSVGSQNEGINYPFKLDPVVVFKCLSRTFVIYKPG